jgi:hypothetical protein
VPCCWRRPMTRGSLRECPFLASNRTWP